MAASSKGKGEENLRLGICNTFLHVKDMEEEARKLPRSQSDTSLYSGSSRGRAEHSGDVHQPTTSSGSSTQSTGSTLSAQRAKARGGYPLIGEVANPFTPPSQWPSAGYVD